VQRRNPVIVTGEVLQGGQGELCKHGVRPHT
jgi:hypothetical protein